MSLFLDLSRFSFGYWLTRGGRVTQYPFFPPLLLPLLQSLPSPPPPLRFPFFCCWVDRFYNFPVRMEILLVVMMIYLVRFLMVLIWARRISQLMIVALAILAKAYWAYLNSSVLMAPLAYPMLRGVTRLRRIWSSLKDFLKFSQSLSTSVLWSQVSNYSWKIPVL